MWACEFASHFKEFFVKFFFFFWGGGGAGGRGGGKDLSGELFCAQIGLVTKGNSFCDFLFASLVDKVLPV